MFGNINLEMTTGLKGIDKLSKGRVQKKNLEFSRFGLTHPPHPCNHEKSGEKIYAFKMLFEQF